MALFIVHQSAFFKCMESGSPVAGPISGASEYTLMAIPRSAGLQRSPTTAEPTLWGAAPPRPARKRKISICVGVWESEQSVLNTACNITIRAEEERRMTKLTKEPDVRYLQDQESAV